ncbi:hypothetical protein NDU88_002279 [Pleurodeles waltl]|uniref:Uncharacterized protein n=1 Tax=Pleurodeles waltl TaxID=8319 RepID=A0AAV7NGN4_PLEWA|nr:hypothetical protein NDU88_002279 [Pleurodeles waltl]
MEPPRRVRPSLVPRPEARVMGASRDGESSHAEDGQHGEEALEEDDKGWVRGIAPPCVLFAPWALRCPSGRRRGSMHRGVRPEELGDC